MLLASQVLLFLRDRFSLSPYRHCLSPPLSHSPSFYSLSLTLILPISGLVSRHLYHGQRHRRIYSAHLWIRHELPELSRTRRVLFGYASDFLVIRILSDFFHHLSFFTQISRHIFSMFYKRRYGSPNHCRFAFTSPCFQTTIFLKQLHLSLSLSLTFIRVLPSIYPLTLSIPSNPSNPSNKSTRSFAVTAAAWGPKRYGVASTLQAPTGTVMCEIICDIYDCRFLILILSAWYCVCLMLCFGLFRVFCIFWLTFSFSFASCPFNATSSLVFFCFFGDFIDFPPFSPHSVSDTLVPFHSYGFEQPSVVNINMQPYTWTASGSPDLLKVRRPHDQSNNGGIKNKQK